MDNVGLNPVRPQPAREPKAVAACFISNGDALDRVPGLGGRAPLSLQKLQQCLCVRVELLKRLAFDARNNRRHEPLRLTHLDDGD